MKPDSYLPYSCQQIDEDDIAAVVEVLRSDWLTTGPVVERFEQAIADYVGCRYAVAVSSGTAALHSAMFAIGIGPGDEVIMPPMTFVATANAVVYQGGTPVFVDIEEDTLLIDPSLIEEKITPRTKAIIAVDYAGQPCDYDALREIVDRHGLYLIADASHSLGAKYKGRKCGTLADLTTFSFHPVKPITCGEGGMIVTESLEYRDKLCRFRNHGIDNDHHHRRVQGVWGYNINQLGYNYRLSDLHCALGLSQLRKLDGWVKRRRQLADYYSESFVAMEQIRPLFVHADNEHGYHLFVIKVPKEKRTQIFMTLRARGVGVNVHYQPAHMHSYLRSHFLDLEQGLCPVAESAYGEIMTLPLYPSMTLTDITNIVIHISDSLSSKSKS